MKRLPNNFYLDKTVLVIGPSESAPEEIKQINFDEYDYVIRLNDHFYDSEKQGLGKRTDIVYHSLLNGQYTKEHLNYIKDNNIKLVARYGRPERKIKAFLHVSGEHVPDWYLYNKGKSHIVPIVLECCPSTGILAIYDALTDGAKKVTALGFDFYETFYVEKPIDNVNPRIIHKIRAGKHRPDLQLRNFSKLVKDNPSFDPIGRFKELFEREKQFLEKENRNMVDDLKFLRFRTQEAIRAANRFNFEKAHDFAKQIFELRETGKKAIFMGNGASYTIANHAALDYMSQLGIQTICAADQAVLTAFANDFGYDQALQRFCKINYSEGDILVCISSSGNSPNVVNAAKWVNEQGGTVVSFTGFDNDNNLSKVAKYNFWVDSKVYNVVESVHNLWLAMICDLMIEWMGNKVGTHGIEI